MKNNTVKYLFIAGFIALLVACSTKKDNFVSRSSHALSTKYNILYNGGIALDKGVIDLKSQYKDNYWEVLPIERMQVSEEKMLPGTTKNADFERSEGKATKAIQKHSMNIGGLEKNSQMDEAHLMLGKTRYYDQRFIPALEAFNYVLYKYPNSDKINEIKIWREKTNMRLENDAIAANNLRKLLSEIKFKDQIYADANAALSQAFLNLEQIDSAMARLKVARKYTKENEEKARYSFILGQIFEKLNQPDSAYNYFQQVIDMNRKSSRQYVIHAHAKQAQFFNVTKGDTVAFLKKFNDLLEDRENRPFLDVLNHQMALFYEKCKKPDVAKKYYNKSIRARSSDTYLLASNYRNLADLYFNKTQYLTAGKYYDSTLTVLEPRSREHKLISKKRANLADVIKYEGIAQLDDSILNIASLSNTAKEKYFLDYIDKLKVSDKKNAEAAKLKKEKGLDDSSAGNGKDGSKSGNDASSAMSKSAAANTNSIVSSDVASTFYFYNPKTVSFGKLEFKKQWGDRSLIKGWRLNKDKVDETANDTLNKEDSDDPKTKKVEEKYTTDYYLKQIPSGTKVLDSIAKERNFAYYQLGVIYKEKFKEYPRSSDKFESLLTNSPEERLVLPTMYNLYKIYEITDPSKATAMKNRIIAQYPSSRYAQILNNESVNIGFGTPEDTYKSLYNQYIEGKYREALTNTDMAIVQFTGEEILSKYELLKANLIGKLYGLTEYKKALNFVALTYPNSAEGKETELFISTKIPQLEALYFNDVVPSSWKIVFQPSSLNPADANTKNLLTKLTKFASERTIEKLTVSTDIYTKDRNLIVIHGIKTKESAEGIVHVLKEYKDYKIAEPATVISSDNYKIVQVYKNLEEYISGKGPTFIPKTKPTIVIPKREETTKEEEIKKQQQAQSESKKGEQNDPDSPNFNPGNPSSSAKKVIEMGDSTKKGLPPGPPKP